MLVITITGGKKTGKTLVGAYVAKTLMHAGMEIIWEDEDQDDLDQCLKGRVASSNPLNQTVKIITKCEEAKHGNTEFI